MGPLLLVLALAAGDAECDALCSTTARALRTCSTERAETCDPFLSAAERLSRAGCSGACYLWCPVGSDFVGGFADAYFNALQRLADVNANPPAAARRRALRSLAVLGSDASEQSLDADCGEQWEETVRRAAMLVRAGVLDEAELWTKRIAEAPQRKATASSALRPQGRNRYDAALAVDAHRETAWCEGVAGSGLGEWIEVDVARSPVARAITSFAFIPGYARDDRSFQRNNRVVRVRVSECGDAGGGVVIDLRGDPDRDPSNDTDVLPRFYGIPAPASVRDARSACVRLTIVEVARGRDDDTCISEIIPLAP